MGIRGAIKELLEQQAMSYLKKRGYFVAPYQADFRYVLVSEKIHNPGVYDEINSNLFLEIATNGIVRERSMLGLKRLYVIWQALQNTKYLNHPTAEIGVYRGGGTAFIAVASKCLSPKQRPHYAIDTFVGHLERDVSDKDSIIHKIGHFGDVSIDEIKSALSVVDAEIKFIKGNYQEVYPSIHDKMFSFVHLDVDLYLPTYDYLNFFTERMPVGGIILVDDYMAPKCPGIREAVEKYVGEQAGKFHVFAPQTEQILLTRIAASNDEIRVSAEDAA